MARLKGILAVSPRRQQIGDGYSGDAPCRRLQASRNDIADELDTLRRRCQPRHMRAAQAAGKYADDIHENAIGDAELAQLFASLRGV